MESFLSCYLEQLSESPRNSLHDRRNRRSMVNYISTLIQGVSQGENCDPQKTLQEAVLILLRHHEISMNSNGSICMMGRYHNVLYVAVKLCYDWQLKDTAVVATLLEHIYSCERTFERIFVGAIFGTKAPHYFSGWKSDFDDQEENLRAMVYFIDHATNAELEVVYDYGADERKVRFIDTPIESCGKATPLKLVAQMYLPDKLHILLRYGALVYTEYSHKNQINIVEILLNRLLEFNHCYPYNIVACLELILKVIPAIELNNCCCEGEGDGGASVQKNLITEKYRDLIDDGLIPISSCGITTPELKHLCRITIRKRLWENYHLPNGIRLLQLPEKLWKYLDLLD